MKRLGVDTIIGEVARNIVSADINVSSKLPTPLVA